MCGSGDTKLKNKKINLYLGYYGASFDFMDKIYCVEGNCKTDITKQEMVEYIKSQCTYDEFINCILEIIDNGSDE